MKRSIWDSLTKDDDDTESLFSGSILNGNCKTENGDLYTGEFYRENLTWYFKCIDSFGNEYDTTEEPVIRLDITLVQFPEGTPEAEVKTFFVANIPNNPLIYNRKREDGTYRKLDQFFNR